MSANKVLQNTLQYCISLNRSFYFCASKRHDELQILTVNKKITRGYMCTRLLGSLLLRTTGRGLGFRPKRAQELDYRLKDSVNSKTYKNLQKRHYLVYMVIATFRRFLNSSAISLHRKARSSSEPPSLSSSSSSYTLEIQKTFSNRRVLLIVIVESFNVFTP